MLCRWGHFSPCITVHMMQGQGQRPTKACSRRPTAYARASLQLPGSADARRSTINFV
jgi:hypothetical protein